MPLRLIVNRAGIEEVHSFRHSPIRIGRNRLNDVCIPASSVSQRHALIRFDDSAITLVDLGSTNGTTVGRRGKVRDATIQLQPGEPLRIAKIVISIQRIGFEDEDCDDELTSLSGPPTEFK